MPYVLRSGTEHCNCLLKWQFVVVWRYISWKIDYTYINSAWRSFLWIGLPSWSCFTDDFPWKLSHPPLQRFQSTIWKEVSNVHRGHSKYKVSKPIIDEVIRMLVSSKVDQAKQNSWNKTVRVYECFSKFHPPLGWK